MCGIVGEYKFSGYIEPAVVKRMTDEIVHRGPDSSGFYQNENVSLGFRRLSIIDLNTGDQPIYNEKKDKCIILNGEIYNYKLLKDELIKDGYIFKTKSDVEVVLFLYEKYGLDCIAKLRGMFAFALWDNNLRQLIVARDRVGIKPLYYYKNNNSLVFASEIKSLLKHPEISAMPNFQEIFEYIANRYVLGPETVFENIYKLNAGSFILIKDNKFKICKYWDYDFSKKSNISFEESAKILRKKITETINLHLNSDVPLGLYLSGGLDSSILLGVISKLVTNPVETFNVHFGIGKPIDENHDAEVVSKHFNSNHHSFQVDPINIEKLEDILWHLEEPIHDPAVIPTFLLSEKAKQFTTVVLTGEGSDETNGGYKSYIKFLKYSKYVGKYGFISNLLPPLNRKLKKTKRLLSCKNDLDLINLFNYSFFDSTITKEKLLVENINNKLSFSKIESKKKLILDNAKSFDRMDSRFYYDMNTWMLEDLLLKVDKTTMGSSLEARVPYLDHELIELTASIPYQYKVNKNSSKILLREAFKDILPAETLNKKQHGFNVPINAWFQNDFKKQIDSVLNYEMLSKTEIFNIGAIDFLKNQHFLSNKNYSSQIWNLFQLVLWFKNFIF